VDGPYQDELGGGVRHITQDVEDVEARHAAAPRLYRARTEPCPEASAVALCCGRRTEARRAVEDGRYEGVEGRRAGAVWVRGGITAEGVGGSGDDDKLQR
jgi:hypothetical protein